MSSKIRVMLVDDHALILDALRHLLNHEPDIEVVASADDGVQFLEMLPHCEIDVVVLDLDMPLDGLTVLERMRHRRTSPRVLILTGHQDREHVRSALALGAEGFIYKHDPFPQLVSAIRQVAQGRMVFPQAAQRWLMRSPEPDDSEDLSTRETEVLSLVASGLTNSEIADRLSISRNTVGFHLKNIFLKLNVTNRTEATVWYFSNKSSFS